MKKVWAVLCVVSAYGADRAIPLSHSKRSLRMKKTSSVVGLVLCAAALVLGQTQRNKSVEAEIIAHEKRAWEAWLKKDKQFFLETATKECLNVVSTGIMNREQWAKASTEANCTVKNYSLDNPKVTLLNPETALLIYSYTLDAVCDGKREPSPVWSSVVFVKRHGKWLVVFHQDTPAAQ
jgi:hypothetical protein